MNAPPTSFFSHLQRLLRLIACVVAPTFLFLVAVIVLAWQFTEFSSRQEILSLTSFLVIMSLSALAFNWSRATHTFASEATRRRIYFAGIDLFLASMLALIASCFAWLQSTPAPAILREFIPIDFQAGAQQYILSLWFWTHWIFLLLALLMTLGAIMSIVLAIQWPNEAS
ncbi:hypothetical protein LOC68_27575 [Blastopirellula sp. JC732]|uniref:Uncharacterized protein n=1 Tax=Blastopirellula sediminis TaxID=2894196 RepID=A0A9X1SJ07_9BACT|nr:hypothetical protein [Blastopirellula sediminis]MCC9604528.1 hypothetical protein [Blastopirellula sediminis]MCC9632173.1 hypothetical protein [Blastopirellula sediminis]